MLDYHGPIPSAENGSPEDVNAHLVSRRHVCRAVRFRDHPFPRRREDFPRRRAQRRGDHARSRPQGRGRHRREAARQAEARGRWAHQEPRPRRRRRHLCADRHGRAERRHGLAPARRSLAADPGHRRGRRLDARRAGTHRGLYRLSALDHARRGVGLARHARQRLRQAGGVALGAGRAEARAHAACLARASGAICGAAREIRLPRRQFQRGLRRGQPARLLPVLRDPAQAHRLLAVRLGRRPGQARALGRRAANLRRGASARRHLFDHAARRPAVDGRRGSAQGRRVQYLCARPEPVGQALGQGLCAAAQRPAGHPARHRQHRSRQGDDLSDRRPGADRQRARLRVRAQSLQLQSRRDCRPEGREGVGRRAQGREGAQPGDHHRLPDHGRGAGDAARGLSARGAAGGCAGRRLRRADHAMVHRFRSGSDRLFGHRRHPCLCQFARVHRPAEGRRDQAAGAQQRGARHQEDRCRRRGGLRAGLGPRRRRSRPGVADRLGRRRRLCVPQSHAVGLRSHRPRRRRARRAERARCLRVHRARRLSHRRDGACDDAVARRRRHRGSGCRPDHGGDAARRRGISPQRGARPGHRRALARRAHHLLGADRNLARRRLFRPEGAGGRRGVVPGRRLCAGSAGIRAHHQGHVDLAEIPRRDSARWPLPLWRARGGARHRGRGEHRQGGGARGLSRLFVRPRCHRPGGSGRRRRHREHPARRPAADQRRRRGNLHRRPRQGARIEQAARGQCRGAAGRAGRPRRRAQAHAADRAQGEHDRREAAVLRPFAQRQRHGEFRGGDGRARRQADRRHGPQMAVAQHRVEISVVSLQRLLELRADQGDAPRRRRHARRGRRQAGQDLRARHLGPLPARNRQRRPGRDRKPPSASIPAGTRSPPRTRPTCSRSRWTSPSTSRATP